MKEDKILRLLDSKEVVDDKELILLLKNNKYRSIFITTYKYFNCHNKENIINFINENYHLEIKTNFKIDLLDLASNIDYFSSDIYNLLKIDLFNRRIYLLKLTILDYINEFSDRKEVLNDFYNLSLNLYERTSNNLIKFQALINLSMIDDVKYRDILMNFLSKKILPFYYYRLINNILIFNKTNIDKNYINDITLIIDKTKNLNILQKQELLKRLNDFYLILPNGDKE